ncbi:hypothetical protein [Tenacibaculum amylolyticum]|uniref:hypothetical protein n=1 Tax=Tenacibaculum amylolyticum TaxID=104269 RepID=UPI003895E3AF
MPSKNEILHQTRREFIESQTNKLLRDKTNDIFTIRQAYVEIADNMLFCSLSTIYRALKPYKTPQKKTLTFNH